MEMCVLNMEIPDLDIYDIAVAGVIDGIVVGPHNPKAEAGITFEAYLRRSSLDLIYYGDKIRSVVDYEGKKHVGNGYDFGDDYNKAIIAHISAEVSNMVDDE
jgi:hypothetical protein